MAGMDDLTAMMIDLAESRRKAAVAMRDAANANALDLSPDKIAELEAEIAGCDAELAELRNS
jgi:hypothetical protein